MISICTKMGKYLNNKRLLIAIAIMFLYAVYIFNSYYALEKRRPRVKNGVLDLTNWNFEEDGIVKLDGEWELYWNQFLTYHDFENSGRAKLTGYFKVPSMWSGYTRNETSISDEGYATYRLKIKTNNKNQLKGLRIRTICDAYKIMINDNMIGSSGVVGKDISTTTAQFNPQIFIFNQNYEEFEIIMQVSNFIDNRGGVIYSIELGNYDQIIKLKEKVVRREILLLGVFLSMLIYHIAVYLYLRRNKPIKYFSLMLFFVIIRTTVLQECLILKVLPLNAEWILFLDCLTACWGIVTLALFIRSMYTEEVSENVIRIIVATISVFTVVMIFFPLKFYMKYMAIIVTFLEITIIYLISTIFLAAKKKKEGAILFLIGMTGLLIASITEILFFWNIIENDGEGITVASIFLLVFIQSVILATKFANGFLRIEKLSEKLISLDKIKDEFLINTSHELKTPLRGIVSIIEHILYDSTGNLKEKEKKDLDIVIKSGKRLLNLVNDIMDYSKLKYDDININKKSVDIKETVNVILEMYKHIEVNKDIEFKNHISKDMPLVYADEDRLTQILFNVVGNAVKFTERGQIIISSVINNDMMEISIEDTGIGIPHDKLEDIFKAFNQGDDFTTRKYRGTGLGLSITKSLVKVHGGEIWIESEVGKGSKVTFSIPISHDGRDYYDFEIKTRSLYINDVLFNPISKEPLYLQQDREITILIVEDDYMSSLLLMNILSKENYAIIVVANGMKALEVLSNNKKIDIVIMDIMLPKMSGYKLCRKIRKEYSIFELPVLMLTSKNYSESISAGIEAGANDFLSKPYTINELKARIKTLLQMKKSVESAINVEMAFLQAQIKPHFLFNALNSIASLCYIDSEKAGELIAELSNYLRGSFDFGNIERFVTMEKELEFIESYLAIEKVRFEEKLNYTYNLCNDLNFMIPTLVLQPIVENAIKHGILPKEEGGNVEISVYHENEFINIIVQDDGTGMSKDKLSHILGEDYTSKSVGIRNVNKRMKRIYGYGIEIESELEKGTKVSIKIPYEGGDRIA